MGYVRDINTFLCRPPHKINLALIAGNTKRSPINPSDLARGILTNVLRWGGVCCPVFFSAGDTGRLQTAIAV